VQEEAALQKAEEAHAQNEHLHREVCRYAVAASLLHQPIMLLAH